MRTIKQRRTKPRTDSNGNIKRSTFSGTSKTKQYVNKNTYLDVLCDPSKCETYRNPILGYRKQLVANCKDASGDIYIDNYAKSCMNADVCYPRIKRIQNKNGCIDESYNYSTNQYLTRRCATAEQQDFFLSNNLVENQKNMFKKCNNCSFDEVCTSCKIPKAQCVTIYKRSNRKFNRQGGVSGGSRVNRLKYQTRMKAQTRRVNGKNNIINGKYPASLYAPGKPLILRDNTCKIHDLL
jgi:hypothetical protein